MCLNLYELANLVIYFGMEGYYKSIWSTFIFFVLMLSIEKKLNNAFSTIVKQTNIKTLI
jgi:hypothetical protein